MVVRQWIMNHVTNSQKLKLAIKRKQLLKQAYETWRTYFKKYVRKNKTHKEEKKLDDIETQFYKWNLDVLGEFSEFMKDAKQYRK